MNDRSSVLIDTIGIKEVKLPAKRKASGPVFRDEIVEDPIAFALIEALIAQHRDDHVLEFPEFRFLAFIDRSADEPIKRHPREIIPLRPPRTPVRITKRLLPLPCRLYIHHSPSHSSASSMVRAPAHRRKRRLAESKISNRESAAQRFESKKRNLFRVAGNLPRVNTG
ncbi:hypothetical protein IFT66_22850 [Rhizobium sp. CFBP 13726]|uniref:hypothetical protein n=1 Tax=Rhizobium sp. CFBP 13726 TaxID=2775296 RepID=UPI0017851EF4|nr:hypothetical protein [Rhizobium sp. CFBP 13726]MBD8653931.1 hypothetical protein [Rhizobium sp. CFBP 13726]